MLRLYLYARVRVFCAQIAHGTAGAACTRSSLRPLFKRRANEDANLGRNVSRERECVSTRHCERSDLSAVARRAKADTRDRLDHPHVAEPAIGRAFARHVGSCGLPSGQFCGGRGWIDTRLDRLPREYRREPVQSGVAMPSFGMRMTGQQSDYFFVYALGLKWR